MAGHRAKALNGEEAASKSWFRARVEISLWRSKQRWRRMIRGHPLMATGVGERVCILAAGRDTAVERGGVDDGLDGRWSMMGQKKITSDG
jgi:hypothetical protein